jgi:PAS domain S-box-containing protein
MPEQQPQSLMQWNSPGTLIRTVDGHVTLWSPELEQRYGYSAAEALGSVSHELLKTTSWQALSEIEALLMEQSVWHGGLIHYRKDGAPVVSANSWHLHGQVDGGGPLVTEVHSDIGLTSEQAGTALADFIATMAHKLSEPLTAVSAYVTGAKRALQPAWPDRLQSDRAIEQAAAHLARTSELLSLMRAIGDTFRRPGSRQLHEKVVETLRNSERVARQSGELAVESKAIQERLASTEHRDRRRSE